MSIIAERIGKGIFVFLFMVNETIDKHKDAEMFC